MKIKLLLTFLICLGTYSMSYASFPVERVKTETATVSNHNDNTTVYVSPAATAAGEKSQGLALMFWIFLGAFAVHRWYLGSPWYWNILFIITLGGLFVWAIIDLVDVLTGNYPAKGGFKGTFW